MEWVKIEVKYNGPSIILPFSFSDNLAPSSAGATTLSTLTAAAAAFDEMEEMGKCFVSSEEVKDSSRVTGCWS